MNPEFAGFLWSSSAILLSILWATTPLVFAAAGGVLSERAGVVMISLEGKMLAGAFAAASVAHLTQNSWLGFCAGGFAGLLAAVISAVLILRLRCDAVVCGAGVNLLVMGLIPLLSKALFATTGQTPSLPIEVRFSWQLVPLALTSMFLLYAMNRWTRLGLLFRFAGESPAALQASGSSALRVRTFAVLGAGILAGWGGASLSLMLTSQYSPGMSAGRGFIALAAVIFASWRPMGALAACLLFAGFETLQAQLLGKSSWIAPQILPILPYLLVLISVVFFTKNRRTPEALGKPL